MARYVFSPANPDDNTAILKLMEVPMPGLISLAMERSPDYFRGAAVQNQCVKVYTCKDSKYQNQIVAVFSLGERQVYSEGMKKWVRYFSDMRIHQAYQHSWVFIRMLQFIRTENLIPVEEFAQAIIFSDNSVMNQLIAKSRRKKARPLNLPKCFLLGKYTTQMVALKKKNLSRSSSNIQIKKATENDLTKMQSFHESYASRKRFYPCYNYLSLNGPYYEGIKVEDFFLAYRKGELIGMVGTWDQKELKQTRVVAYQQPLKTLRPLLKFISSFSLPQIGSTLNYFSLHSLLIKENAPAVLCALLDRIILEFTNREYDYFLCGLDTRDPLNRAFEKMKAKRTVEGNHFLVSQETCNIPDPEALFYFEVGRI